MGVRASALIAMLALIVIGLMLIIASSGNGVVAVFDWKAAASTIGTVLVIGSITSFFLDVIARRSFFEEIFKKIVSATGISATGIEDAFINSTDIDYRPLIKTAKEILIHFTYSDGFIKRYRSEIDEAIRRGASFKVIILDPKSSLQDYLTEQGWQLDSRKASWANIDNFAREHAGNPKVDVIFLEAIPRYSSVLIDNSIFVIEHTLAEGRTDVPAMKFNRSSGYGKFYVNDLKKACEAHRSND